MAAKKTTDDKLKAILERLEEGTKAVFTSGRYQEYLSVMQKFHSYSFNNSLLILLQRPDASYVAGYRTWQTLERQVKKGETGITILAPCPHKRVTYEDKIDPVTQEPVRDRDGNPVRERKEITYASFRPVAVFDYAQTEGKELATLTQELQGQVSDYRVLMDSIREISPAPIRFGSWPDSKKGYYSPMTNEIVLKSGMSELQTIKTAIHELSHSILHSGPKTGKDRSTMETEAESIAFVVSKHLGLDVDDYSFGYLAGWSSTRELPELQASLSTIQKTSHQLIEQLDRAILKHTNNLDISQSIAEESMEIPSIADTHTHRRRR